MATKTIAYLPAPEVKRPLPSTEKNHQKVAVCTIALGIFSYYAPKTFYATSAGLLVTAIWKFSPMVNQNPDAQADDIRKWVINACSVGFSVGLVFLFRSGLCFGSAASALRQFHIMRTGGNLIAGIFTGCIGLGLYHFTQKRAQELLKTAHWEQMEDYLHAFTGDWRKSFHTKGGKFMFFLSVFFPKISPDNTKILSQFKSPEDKKIILTKYLKNKDTIPVATNHINRRRWVVVVHYFQGLSFWDQETLMPELVRIGRSSKEQDVDELPGDLNVRLKTAMKTYQQKPLPYDITTLSRFEKIPEVGTEGWESWVKGINEFRKFSENTQMRYLAHLQNVCMRSRNELIEVLPEPVRSQLAPPGLTF